MVADEEYQMEVDMLRPGTTVPHPSTVSRDMANIYLALSVHVWNYFLAPSSTIHLILDGWTSPLVSSYLGIVVMWYQDGIIHRAILEFIREKSLKKSHTGEYLAEVVANCLKSFGLDKLLFSICMDNATNCDKLAELLPNHITSFWGSEARLQCLAHILNLIAKVFISFFFKKPKPKKKIKISSTTQNRRAGRARLETIEEEIVIDEGDQVESDDEAAQEEAETTAEADGDDGESAHDEAVTKSIHVQANQMMQDQGVTISTAEEKMALQLFPKVAGLARRIHDSGELEQKFDTAVSNDTELTSSKRVLDRRVPAQWNSELACLSAHIHFKTVIQQLTGVGGNKLQSYWLTDEQWDLAKDVQDFLELFEGLTRLFSQAQVPLIVDAVPLFEKLKKALTAVRDDAPPERSDRHQQIQEWDENPTPNIIHIAAQASLLLTQKYDFLTQKSEIYNIAIVMCPDRKLNWFRKNRGYGDIEIRELKTVVINRWNMSYKTRVLVQPQRSQKSKKKWVESSDEDDTEELGADDINTYLQEEPIPSATIKDVGGYMKYWHHVSSSRPNLSRMGSDFCSAPATSVDAERAFSTGRCQVNFMQHNMSSQTFKAQMAVGSWVKTPLYPGIDEVASIIMKRRAHEKDD